MIAQSLLQTLLICLIFTGIYLFLRARWQSLLTQKDEHIEKKEETIKQKEVELEDIFKTLKEREEELKKLQEIAKKAKEVTDLRKKETKMHETIEGALEGEVDIRRILYEGTGYMVTKYWEPEISFKALDETTNRNVEDPKLIDILGNIFDGTFKQEKEKTNESTTNN